MNHQPYDRSDLSLRNHKRLSLAACPLMSRRGNA